MKISVIIPTLNEEACLENLLSSLAAYDFGEIIVADGGSTDRTRHIARAYTPKVIDSPVGRGIQLNRGAEEAGGDVLLFLHADSRIKNDIIPEIRRALTIPGVVGGAFRLKIDSTKPGLRLISAAANLRARLLGLAFGDQGIFVKREVFDKLGGFSNIPLMEDVDFINRLRRAGKFVILNEDLPTSPRRWQQEGIIACTLRNWLILSLHTLGVPAGQLQKWYKNVR
jgi:rSAM/selenodomain-associated transferase 2